MTHARRAFALGAIGAVESVQAIVNLLGREDRELQSTLVSVLERFGARVVPPVIDALAHAHWSNIGNETAVDAIRPMCEDTDARVRVLAAKMVARRKGPVSKPYSSSSRPSSGS